MKPIKGTSFYIKGEHYIVTENWSSGVIKYYCVSSSKEYYSTLAKFEGNIDKMTF